MIGGTVALSLAIANIMSNPVMPDTSVRHDVDDLFRLDASIVYASEVAPDFYKTTFRRTARAAGYRTVGLASENPLAVRRDRWDVASAHIRFLTPGYAAITPTRTATVAVLDNRLGDRLVVICTHLVSGAWARHPVTAPTLRRALWTTAVHKIRALIHRWHQRGVDVLVAGDLNRPGSVRWTPRTRVIANTGLLQLALIPASRKTRITATSGVTIPTSNLFTDHPIIRRGIRLIRYRPVS